MASICVTVSKDIDGGEVPNNILANGDFQPADVGDVFSLLQESNNLPPFMNNLVTALQVSNLLRVGNIVPAHSLVRIKP